LAIKSVAVYCGANSGLDEVYERAAGETGRTLAQRGIALVYGGGNVGLMGVLADAALAAGGSVKGVMPEFLIVRELAHPGIQLHRVQTMHERKAQMLALSDGVIALPGGLGTLDELFEALTWLQLGQIHHPVGLLDVNGFYQPLLAMIRHLCEQGFVRREHLQMICVSADLDELLAQMSSFKSPDVSKWQIER
jgi:uncharacterized protein (TIGR00730 family)